MAARTAPTARSRANGAKAPTTPPPGLEIDPTPAGEVDEDEIEGEDDDATGVVRRAGTKIATLHIRSWPGSPYSPSQYVSDQSVEGESKDDYDDRIKDQKAHYENDDLDGFKPSPEDIVVLPPMAVRKALEAAAKIGGYKVPGRMRMTWTTIIRSGLLVPGPIRILDTNGKPIRRKDLGYIKLHLDAQGVSGGGSRVHRRFPIIRAWQAEIKILIMNPAINPKILRTIAEDAGTLVGFGRHRMEVGGNNGLFEVNDIDWATRS